MSLTLTINGTIGFVEFDQPGSKVNLLTADNIKRLDQILDEVKSNRDLKAIVFLSKKKNIFIAGADIKEIEQIIDPAVGAGKSKAGQDILNKLEDLPMPTIAVIDGVALGGGCELALACGYRVATFNDKIRIGLPEINLGFVPGFGGTYRLPRLVGLAEGMKMILSGKSVDAAKALKIGLVDRVVPQTGLTGFVHDFIADIEAKKIHPDKYLRHKKKTHWSCLLDDSLLFPYLVFIQSRKSVMKLSKGFYPAPLSAIELIKKTFYLRREKGLALEAEAFGQLAVTDISKNLVQVFYLSEQYKKLSVGDGNVEPLMINKCGVCGAGVMGGGIAQLLSYKGIWVRLKDINHAAIGQGLKAAAKLFTAAVKKRRMTKAQAEQDMGRITGALDYSGFQNADIVIEAVVEKMDVKKQVFKELSAAVSDRTILATNTSALSVSEMAKETKDPGKVVGFHFFNPVHRMPLVEVITTEATSQKTIATALQLARRLGKTPILVKDSCGFVVNRILLGYINEAGRILEECGSMEGIDQLAAKFGMPMGPFLLSDEVGLDVGVKVMHILQDGFGDRFKPVTLFDRILEKGFLGKKTGKGFYLHGKKRKPNPEILSLMLDKVDVVFKADVFLKRMIYIMINEAARCLEDGIVDEAGAIDVGMIFGTGFPPFRGGLLRYADSIGVDEVVHDLETFNQQYGGDRFKPCDYLLHLKDQKKTFY